MGELTIMLVDDEEILVKSLEKFFRRKEFNVISCHRVKQALQIIDAHTIQILVTDMRMPDGTGIEIIKSFRKKFPGGVIFCATGFSEEDEGSIKEAGADVIVTKPFEKKELLKQILEKLS